MIIVVGLGSKAAQTNNKYSFRKALSQGFWRASVFCLFEKTEQSLA